MLWLKQNFNQFNQQYFDGVLIVPRFYIGHSRTRLGSLSFKRKIRWSGKTQLYDFTLSMSNYYDQTEYQFRNVLLHEMIHLSIAQSGMKDTSAHGLIFRGMMDRLNREGWNISVMTAMKGAKKAYTGSANVIRNYLVLALEMDNGEHFLSSVNPSAARKLKTMLMRVPTIRRSAWYTTNDRYFEDMPKVRSLRGRKVDGATFNKMTQKMTLLSE